MINTYIDFISHEDVLLRVEGMENYEIYAKTEWLPKGSRVGDMVQIEFHIRPRAKKLFNVYLFPLNEYDFSD